MYPEYISNNRGKVSRIIITELVYPEYISNNRGKVSRIIITANTIYAEGYTSVAADLGANTGTKTKLQLKRR